MTWIKINSLQDPSRQQACLVYTFPINWFGENKFDISWNVFLAFYIRIWSPVRHVFECASLCWIWRTTKCRGPLLRFRGNVSIIVQKIWFKFSLRAIGHFNVIIKFLIQIFYILSEIKLRTIKQSTTSSKIYSGKFAFKFMSCTMLKLVH